MANITMTCWHAYQRKLCSVISKSTAKYTKPNMLYLNHKQIFEFMNARRMRKMKYDSIHLRSSSILVELMCVFCTGYTDEKDWTNNSSSSYIWDISVNCWCVKCSTDKYNKCEVCYYELGKTLSTPKHLGKLPVWINR